MRKKSSFEFEDILYIIWISALVTADIAIGVYFAMMGEVFGAAFFVSSAFLLITVAIMTSHEAQSWACSEILRDVKEIKEEVKKAKEREQ